MSKYLEREKLEQRLGGWLDRAIMQRRPYTYVAELARQCYGSKSENFLEDKAPSGHWNFYKTAVQNIRSKCIEGEPRVTTKGRDMMKGVPAEWFASKLNPIFTSSSISPILQSVCNDTIMFGGGYIYIPANMELEYLYWFNVYVDNAQATPQQLEKGRFIFIRRLIDKVDFSIHWKKELEKLEYEFNKEDRTFSIESAKSLPGYSPAGVEFYTPYQLAETHTGLLLDKYGKPYNSQQINESSVDCNLDGLIEEWECYYIDDESPSGWMRCFMNPKKEILGEPEPLPDWMDGPPITAWIGDYLGGQFYQPTLFCDTIRSQSAYNFLDAKIMQNVAFLENPVIIQLSDMRNKLNDFTNKPGERIFEDTINSTRYLNPPVIPAQYFAIKNYLKSDLESNSGIHDIIQGKEPEEVKSGIAMEKLEQNALTRFQSILQSRDEWLADLCRWICLRIYAKEQEYAESLMQQEDEEYNKLGIIDKISYEKEPSGNYQDYMPEQLKDIDIQEIKDDLIFTFRIVPPQTIEERVSQILRAIINVSQAGITMQDPILAVRMSGIITENQEIAQQLEQVIMQRMEELQPQIEEQQKQERAAMEDQKRNEKEMAVLNTGLEIIKNDNNNPKNKVKSNARK